MIRTDESKDRGHELWRMFPGQITSMIANRKKRYFDSPQFRGFRNSCRAMDQYIDNASPAANTFISDITPPVIRKAYVEYTSLFAKFLETDPLFSVRRSKSVTPEQEHAIIAALTDNNERTYYRERCLHWSIDHIVRYGTAVTYTFATSDHNANSLMTIKGDDGEFGTYSQVVRPGETMVMSTPIHPLNAIVDPRANFMVQPDYLGFIGDISVSSIATLMQNPAYIQKNLKKAYDIAKAGVMDENFFTGIDEHDRKDLSQGHTSITYLWTRLPFEGNEDDPTWYACEMIDGLPIRIEENPLDDNTIPIAIKRILPRQYSWYGNSPLSDKVCIQNMEYWLINTTVESTARLMDRIVLYREGSLDVEAINGRHTTGGLVPYRGQEPIDKLIYSPSLPNVSYRESDWLMQEMRRQDADTSSIPNFNPQSAGGPGGGGQTLGGQQLMASLGEMKAGGFVGQMAIGLKDVGKHKLVIMRNVANDTQTLPDGTVVNREHLLGEINIGVKISNVYNYIRESVDSQNRLSQLINYKATKLPMFAAIKTGRYIEDWVRNSVKRENIEDYVDMDALREMEKTDLAAAITPPQQPPQQAGGAQVEPPKQPAPTGPLGGPVQ